MTRTFFLLPILLFAGATGAAAQDDDSSVPDSAAATVDFATQVRPILKMHCIECHSGEFPRGGLDLDTFHGAVKRGDSGETVLGADLTTNELWLRISSDDETLRMPKGAPALSPEELQTIREWLKAGAPWPEQETITGNLPSTAMPTLPSEPPKKLWYDYEPIASLVAFEEHTRAMPNRTNWFIVLMAGNLCFLILEKRRRAYEQKLTDAGQPLPAKRSLLHRVNASHLVAFLAIFALTFLFVLEKHLHGEATAKSEGLEKQLAQYTGTPSMSRTLALFGDPPKPIRLRHAKGLAKTFYRGNCEISESLYNEGNYCTAIFELRIVDADGQSVGYDAPVPESGLSLDFVMRRAPGATAHLFSPGVIKSLFLSSKYYGTESVSGDKSLQQLQTDEKDWAWSTRIPLPAFEKDNCSGVIYLYKGEIMPEAAKGEAHYGIVYDLKSEQGMIAKSSDLWMGALYFSPSVQLPDKERLPSTEWFDVRPLPIIEGKNTSDPKLLGVEEHLGKQVPEAEAPLVAPR